MSIILFSCSTIFLTPFLSLSLLSIITNSFIFYHNTFLFFFPSPFFSFLLVCMISFLWWNDFLRESMLGYHTHNLESSLRVGFLLFILSEVFFFISFFWAFYDASLSPVVELGLVWPPNGISPLPVYSVPLLNTVILLTSGISVTWAHHSIINNFFY